jgi:acyl carrier protein
LRARVIAGDAGGPAISADRIVDRYGTPCPCVVETVDRLPPEGSVASDEPVSATAPPATDLQRTIAAIWQDVLGLASVGIHQSFFEIGGQSLALMQVHSRLRDALNRKIDVVDLLQYPTVATLAAFLGEAPSRTAAYDEAVERAKRQQASRQRRKPVARLQPN